MSSVSPLAMLQLGLNECVTELNNKEELSCVAFVILLTE